jgi:hypothetical protein
MLEQTVIIAEAGLIVALLMRVWYLENLINRRFGGEEEKDNDKTNNKG